MSKQTQRERLFLLDGMALAYRAYFSFISHPLMNSKGENTSAIFGFANTLIKILNDEKPEHIAVIFDTKAPTFRHKMYEPYKATRQKMPEDMVPQLDKLKEVVRAFNVPSLELNGYEADDIMGTLARKAEREGILTFLVTGDKDFMQLISPDIKMFRPGKHGDEWEIVDEKNVLEKFGVEPKYVVDVLGLTGDSSDNVPGVMGVGEKTAIPLIQKYGTIEKVYQNIDSIPQAGLQNKLRENKDNAFLSKKLVTIDTQVPINVDIHHLISKPHDTDKLIKLFVELEFKNLIRKIKDNIPIDESTEFDISKLEQSDINNDEHKYHLVTTEKDLQALFNQLKASKQFVFDTETTSTDPLQADLVGLSFAVQPREAWYVPILQSIKSNKQHDLFSSTSEKSEKRGSSINCSNIGFPIEDIKKIFAPIFSDKSIKKIGQNIKYDVLVLATHGIHVKGDFFDTIVAHYILRPDGQHNLDSLATEQLHYKMISYDDLTGTGKDRKDIRDILVASVAEYSAQDADITYRLYEKFNEKLGAIQLKKLCDDVEFPLISVLADMEKTGVALDLDFLSNLSKELERTIDNCTTEIFNLAGEEFNINSTQQLAKILFEKMKLSAVKRTKTGFSTDVSVLETLRQEHPIIEKLLDYRQIQKLKTTYVDALPLLINQSTGRVHTSFNQTIATTGRLSSSDPNLQNIPIRTEIGSQIRRAFIPGGPKMIILSADYSQIELRIMAHISDDPGLKEAFNNAEDIHSTTAAKVFGVNQSEVTKDMRRKAKEVNFGIMYGIGAFGLSNRLDISQSEGKQIITKYFERFPKVNQYIFDTISKAKHDGFVSTLLGRRRYLPDINSRNHNIRSNAERQAINMPIQGSAADMIKLAMINIHKKIQESKLNMKMLLQVHDELVFEIETNENEKAMKMIISEMKNALPLSVPIEVDVGIGNNWLEAHK